MEDGTLLEQMEGRGSEPEDIFDSREYKNAFMRNVLYNETIRSAF